jgi:hypothetical protein
MIILKKKTIKGSIKKIIHNNVELEHHIGNKFLNYIFKDNTNKIIEFIKKTIDNY